ncbi:MAG: phage portal protein [Pseudomonadota bacterium]
MVLNLFKHTSPPAAPQQKASAAGRVMAHVTGGRVAWSPRDAVSLTRTAFTRNPVGFRAVKLIAEAAAHVPVLAQSDIERFSTHPILDLLAQPNPNQTRADLFEALFGQLLLNGNAYVELVLGDDGALAELHVLRSDRMAVVPGADGWPVAYEYSVGAQKHRYDMTGPLAPICHIKSFHPLDDHYGLSAAQAAAAALDVHNAASQWSKALLDNAARPSGALVYSGSDGNGALTHDQYDRLQSEMSNYHQGARNAGRPMLLEGGLDWKPMGFSPSDMEFQKTKDAAAREIAMAFGVPPMLLGIPGDATYANYAEANRAFYRHTVLPLANRVTASLGAWLRRAVGDGVHLRPDLDHVPALAVERETLWRRVGDANFLTLDEKRQMLGLPPVAKGEDDD